MYIPTNWTALGDIDKCAEKIDLTRPEVWEVWHFDAALDLVELIPELCESLSALQQSALTSLAQAREARPEQYKRCCRNREFEFQAAGIPETNSL